MSYAAILRNLPEELRFTMLELIEAVEENMREQLAVRREDFDSLQATMREVADVQYHTAERVDRLENAIIRLTEAQEQTEERVEELAEAQKRTELRLEELVEAQSRLTDAVNKLTKRVDVHDTQFGKWIGYDLERRYREKAFGYFGRLLRKARAVELRDIEDNLDAHLSEDELDDLRLADVIVYGRPRQRPDVEGVWLVVEVSAVVDRNDVERARRRAAVMRKAGYLAVATVAGEERTAGADEAAKVGHVLLFQNGSVDNWEEALGEVLGSVA